ncbi:hypothetical protein GF342_03965 [Candidatus Woesearchaeota archaeon]|nr:hypothetical protein [Candidatus Woesearchaeota archaeon]
MAALDCLQKSIEHVELLLHWFATSHFSGQLRDLLEDYQRDAQAIEESGASEDEQFDDLVALEESVQIHSKEFDYSSGLHRLQVVAGQVLTCIQDILTSLTGSTVAHPTIPGLHEPRTTVEDRITLVKKECSEEFQKAENAARTIASYTPSIITALDNQRFKEAQDLTLACRQIVQDIITSLTRVLALLRSLLSGVTYKYYKHSYYWTYDSAYATELQEGHVLRGVLNVVHAVQTKIAEMLDEGKPLPDNAFQLSMRTGTIEQTSGGLMMGRQDAGKHTRILFYCYRKPHTSVIDIRFCEYIGHDTHNEGVAKNKGRYADLINGLLARNTYGAIHHEDKDFNETWIYCATVADIL